MTPAGDLVPFISYAQNFEDVTLWRALKDVTNGFFIDVGAWDADLHSVTRAFSERGWRGINVEPVPVLCEQIIRRRPRDITLCMTVGADCGKGVFYNVVGSGLSTVNATAAAEYKAQGWTVEQIITQTVPLSQLCREHALGTIHFLKVDCEGDERNVLLGGDFKTFRPWIILVEATEPLTQTPSFKDWEPILLEAGYRFAWFDGLNRFYVADEHAERLIPLVAKPPSIFDDFVTGINRTLAPDRMKPLLAQPNWQPPAFSEDGRIELAMQCRDCDDLPKVERAGEVVEDLNGTRVQVMHNGVRVPADGYCGAWMTELIRQCHGHHEPQEERQFYAVLPTLPSDATMIELGSNWGYYTAWFLQGMPSRRAVMLEPDPLNRAVGEQTIALNDLRATFVAATAGATSAPPAPFITERSGTLLLPCFSVPDLMAEHGLERVNLLHCDVQGGEFSVLTGCRKLFLAGQIDHVFVSTHAPQISGDALTHDRCLDLLRDCGATIEAEHDAWESFSGDGLIYARFGGARDWQPTPFSVARHRNTLFRIPLQELAQASVTGSSIEAVRDDLITSVFKHVLLRDISPVDLAFVADELANGRQIDDWLLGVFRSPELQINKERFCQEYGLGYTALERASVPPVPASSPVSCVAVQVQLNRATALGQAGNVLLVPNDRVILPAVLATGDWSLEQVEFLVSHLNPERNYVLLDVGANIGLFSRQVLFRFNNVTSAHCIEPDNINYQALCHNLAGLRPGTLSTYQIALGVADGTTTFFRDTENCGNLSVHEDAMRGRQFTATTVPITAAGPWLSKILTGEDLIIWKSDTQGNDEVIVAETPWPVWRRVQIAIIELWRINKGSTNLIAFLERVADMPHCRIGAVEATVDDVARYLSSEDWKFEDLYLWR